MKRFIMQWNQELEPGVYKANRTLTTIEDPRGAEYDGEKRMKGTEWETTTIIKDQPFRITGTFEFRNKKWSQLHLKKKTKKPQVINNIVLVGAKLEKQ